MSDVLSLLEKHTGILTEIKIDVAVLKARETITIAQYTQLEERLKVAEKMIIYSWVVTVVILSKIGMPYLQAFLR